MSLEDSNREIFQFKSYEININNPVAINLKKSEREKKINPQMVNDEKSKKEVILPEEQNQPIDNYPYEFYEETQSKKEISKNENENSKKEEKKEENYKQEREKIIEKPKIEEKKKEQEDVNQKNQKKDDMALKKEQQKIKKKEETKNEEKKKLEQRKEEPKKDNKKKVEQKKEEKKKEDSKKEEPKKEEKKKEEQNKVVQKIEKPKYSGIKKEVKEEIKKEAEVTNSLKEKLKNQIKKEDKKIEKTKKEETNPQKQIKNEEKKIEKIKPKMQNDENKKELIKANQPIFEEKKKKEPKNIQQNLEPQKNNEKQIINQINEINEIKEIKNETVQFKGLDNRNREGKNSPPPLREMKDSYKVAKLEDKEELPKTLLTKKTEDNYELMIKYFKEENYKRSDDVFIEGIINYNDFSSDKFLGLVSEKIKMDNSNKNAIYNFLQRNTDDIKLRQDNNKSINNRIKLIDESTKKKLYFNNKQSQQEYFDSFYNKQIEYKNNYKEHLNKLSNKYDQERKKYYVPEPKNKNNLDYFKNNEPVKISKYSFKAKHFGKNNNENIIKEKSNEDKNQNGNKDSVKCRFKKTQSFDPNLNDISYNTNNNKDNAQENSKNDDKIVNTNSNNERKKIKKIKSGPILTKKGIKLTKKEVEEMTNKLHYDGELLKIKKQNSNEDSMNNSYYNYSSEKLTHSSIIILIKKLLFEYCTSIMKNAYSDYMKNPKINYEQYIDVLKDLYYLEIDALPEDYLEEDSMYKELWNKLIQFSTAPVNSIESNVLLLYLLELNGFFSNEKILKELEKELYWIKLEEYDDLIANAKYIEENWDDLKIIKINIIKRLKLEGKYNPIHCEALYINSSIASGNIINSNLNSSSVFNNDNDNANTNHYLTTLKGNTNYHFIHGYNSNNKNNEKSILRFSKNSSDKTEENKLGSFSISNLSNKNIKNRVPLKDSYKDLIEKKKSQIENMKKDKEEKLKEICTFKPQINSINKKIFSKEIKIELPKHKINKSLNLYNNSITQENKKDSSSNNIEQNQKLMTVTNQVKTNNISCINNDKKNTNKKALKRNKSSLQKMFRDNPLKEDKSLNDKIEKLKMTKFNKDMENYNNLYPAMRFDIEYPSKFESIGITINREENMKQRTHNVIFYNIKVNEKIKTLKYIEGDDLKLTVINFVNRNKLPEEVIDIILSKIKEKK